MKHDKSSITLRNNLHGLQKPKKKPKSQNAKTPKAKQIQKRMKECPPLQHNPKSDGSQSDQASNETIFAIAHLANRVNPWKSPTDRGKVRRMASALSRSILQVL